MQESAIDEEDPFTAPTPSDKSESSLCTAAASQLGSNGTIFGFQSLAQSLQFLHPPLSPSVSLLRVFTENVAPLVRIFHMPTTARIYWDAIASRDSPPDKNIEALLFAIYYSAVISMGEPKECLSILGIPRDQALTKYRFAVEQALARADLLNTQSITLLQAAVLFLWVLRSADNSRTAWSLSALVFHIARVMGLHRDGTVFGLNPFQTETRRRLWYHICLLDNRSSEHNGCEPIMPGGFAFDTKFPLHINDNDLTPDMIAPPPERDEMCDMTFCLMRCEAMAVDIKTNYPPPGSMPGRSFDRPSREDRQRLVEELRTRLEARCLRYCDPSSPFGLFTSTVARLIISHATFGAMSLDRSSMGKQHEHERNNDHIRDHDSSIRNQLFQTSIDILELSSLLLTNKTVARWSWHSRTHVQWHAVAFVLSDICLRLPGPDCDRAWNLACTVYENWAATESEQGEKNNMLWRPIKRLLAKAQYVRDQQQRQRQRQEQQEQQQSNQGVMAEGIHNRASSGVTPADGLFNTTFQDTSAFPPLDDVISVNPHSPNGDLDLNALSVPGMDWDPCLDFLSDPLYPLDFSASALFPRTELDDRTMSQGHTRGGN